MCGGCRARAFAVTGDVLAEDPSCVYEPAGDREPIPRPRAVAYGDPAAPSLAWAPEASERLGRVPSFVRGVVSRRVEDYARARGLATVTPQLMDDVRRALPVDFSRKRPFFLRDA